MSDNQTVTRSSILTGVKAILEAGDPLPCNVGENIYIARVNPLPSDKLPAVLLYAPDETAEPMGSGWSWSRTVTFAIEIQAKYLNGMDGVTWIAQAEQIIEAAKVKLFQNAAWRALWKGPPRFSLKQYLRDQNVDVPHVGEIITFTLEPLRPLTVKALTEALEGIDLKSSHVRSDGTVPAEPDKTLTLNVESESNG